MVTLPKRKEKKQNITENICSYREVFCPIEQRDYALDLWAVFTDEAHLMNFFVTD